VSSTASASQLPWLPVMIEDGTPGVRVYPPDGGAFPGVRLPTDGIGHPVSGSAGEGGDVLHQAVGGAGTISSDQQVAAIKGRDLPDGLLQHLDVIGGGVESRAAGAQEQRQRFTGVVTPDHQRMVTPGRLIGARCELLVGMRDHQRGVHPDHDRRPQLPVGDPRGWNPTVSFDDQRPHMLAGRGGYVGDPASLPRPGLPPPAHELPTRQATDDTGRETSQPHDMICACGLDCPDRLTHLQGRVTHLCFGRAVLALPVRRD
jgi:hypothetical protein